MLHARIQTRIFALLLPILGATSLILLQYRPLLPLANSTVLINETDAETPGTDTAEFVELYDGGAGNTNMDGLVLVFFNGQDDRSYRTIDLTGHQTSAEGYFLLGNEFLPGVDLTFPDNLLQNGADAVALYLGQASDYPDGTAVSTADLQDAIVYGSSSPDDPGLLILLQPGEPQVDENGLDFAEYHSNQRCPNGSGGQRRTANYIQELPTPKMSNDCPVVTDNAPQVENTFPTTDATSVAPDTNITITFSEEVVVSGDWHNISCTLSGTHTTFVTGDDTIFTIDPAIDFTYGDNCSVTLFGELIKDVDTQDPPDQMIGDYSWSFSIVDPPVADHVIINEIDVDTPGTDAAEFIELYDGGTGATNLNRLVIVLFNGSDDLSYRAVDLDGQFTDDQGYFVIGNSAVNNVDLVIPDGLIQNGADAIALYQGSEDDFPNDTGVTTSSLLDAVVYDTDDADDNELLILQNRGEPQVNEASRDNPALDSNQRCPNGSGGQRNTTSYRQNLPSPGVSNNCTFDSAPHVSATWPTDGQQNIGQNISLTVTFNEAVQASTGAFKLECSTSGSHSLTKSDGPLQFTLTPDAGLALGESCTAAVIADEISDQDSDDPPDHLVADYTWSFTIKTLPVAMHMLINEVDADTPGTDTAEFIELFDGGTGGTRLDGLVLVLFNGNGDASYRAIDLDGNSTGASGYFTVGGSETPNVDLLIPSGLIQNGADAIALFAADSANFPNGSPVTQSGLIDALVYDTNDADDLGLLSLLNSDQPQINEAARSNQEFDSNQRCPNGQGGQRNSSGYLQNPATPGKANYCLVDKPPHVIATSPSAGEKDVSLDTAITVSFSEDVTVNENWFEINCSQSLVHSVTQSGGPKLYTLHPQENFESGELCLVTLFASAITDRDGLPQPMNNDHTWTFTTGTPVFGSCGGAAMPIHLIQGRKSSSPFESVESVVVEGIVTGDFQGTAALDGFFLQEESEEQDDHSETSEGIFIHDAGKWADVSAGEIVRAQGTVREIDGQTSLTELIAMSRCASAPDPAPIPVELPLPSQLEWERFEGMSISLPQELTLTGSAELGSEGVIDLALPKRLFVPTELVDPGEAAETLANLNERSRIKIDDGSNQSPVYPLPPYLKTNNTLRIGDGIRKVVGVLAESAGRYRIHPTVPLVISQNNVRLILAQAPEQTVRIALFDTGGYFNGDGHGSGFPGRGGAATAEEFARQRAKIINTLLAMDAHIIGLLSIENDGYGPDSAIQDLINGLNDQASAGTAYVFVDPLIPEPGAGDLAVGLIYQPDILLPQGSALTFDQTPFDSAHVRPLIQAFSTMQDDGEFVIAVAHFKDRDECPSPDDQNADQLDGQECWNSWRVRQAETLAGFLASNATAVKDVPFLIMGNLNAYSLEDPLASLVKGGYVDLVSRTTNRSYTTVIDGESGAILHALGSSELSASLANVQQWHINADEPSLLDYRATNPPLFYSPDVYRSAVHDPLVIDLYSKPFIRSYLPFTCFIPPD